MVVLLTGSSGFLGRIVVKYLRLQNDVLCLSNSLGDYIASLDREIPKFREYFDVIIHAAGKAHSIPKTDADKDDFFDVNLQGTINLCYALEKSGIPKSFIFISTVAVYGLDAGENITEDYPLKGSTPYALSKIQAEQFLTEWCEKHNVILTILRPSLIAGPNPPGNLGAMINGIRTGKYLSIGGGKARKSVLMVQDIANLIPLVVNKGGVYNVCDSEHPTFRDLEVIISNQLGRSLPMSIPYKLAKLLARLGDLVGNKAPINTDKFDKITKSLTFSNEKAKKELGWEPLDVKANFKI